MILIQMLAEEFGNLGSSTFRVKNTLKKKFKAFFGILWHEHIYFRCIHSFILAGFSEPNGSFYVLARLGLALLFDTPDLLLICGHSTPEHRPPQGQP